MKYAVKILSLTVWVFSASACSNQMVYNLIQSNQRTECTLLPQGQVDSCLASVELSYTEYLEARELREESGEWAEHSP